MGDLSLPLPGESLLAKHLTPPVLEALQNEVDAVGFSLDAAIASGVAHPDSSTGVYAGSADSYRAFAPLFDSIIVDYHGEGVHRSDWTGRLPNLPAASQAAIRSTRMRVARNLTDLPFGAACTAQQRLEVEQRIVAALQTLDDDLAGTYLRLGEMDEAERQQLVDDHLLFQEGDRFLDAAGLTRDWPEGRGMYVNHDRTALVWINEEDHLRIISIEEGGDVQAVFNRLRRLHAHLESRLSFAQDPRLGYLTSCPTNLGTGLRASVHVQLPERPDSERQQIAATHHVQLRGIHGEHSQSQGGVWDVSNKRRLGWTEAELVTDMLEGTQALLATDRRDW